MAGGSQPVSPLTKDDSRVQTKGDDLRDDYLQAWQDLHGNGRPGDVMIYSMKGLEFESTGTQIDLELASGSYGVSTTSNDDYSYEVTSENDNDNDEEDEGGFWDNPWGWTKDKFSGLWDGIAGWLKDAIKVIFGTILAFIAFVITIYVGAAFVDNITDRIMQLRNGEMTRREALARVIKFDIFKFANERVQSKMFTKTFSDIQKARENDEKAKGFREKIGSALQRIVSFDVVNTVMNKPLQLATLTTTLDKHRRDKAENFKKDKIIINGGLGKTRVNIRSIRDMSKNARAHVLDALVSFDIFKEVDEAVQSLINTSKGERTVINDDGQKEKVEVKIRRTFNEVIKDQDRWERDEEKHGPDNQNDKSNDTKTENDSEKQTDSQSDKDKNERDDNEKQEGSTQTEGNSPINPVNMNSAIEMMNIIATLFSQL